MTVKVAVLSGKGGAGKTLVAVNLASIAGVACYVDCDVEEPNGHLYFRPSDFREQVVSVPTPVIDHAACTGGRQCVEFCRFNALAYVDSKVLVFEDLCHSCGACQVICPEGAITERSRVIGHVRSGSEGAIAVHGGIMLPGIESGVPIIQELLRISDASEELTLIDCPPGASCPVIESVRGADYCVLVAEPTLFGAHNLALVHELVTLFNKPCGVVINKSSGNDALIDEFCRARQVAVLGRIPYDARLAEWNADGRIVAREDPAYAGLFGSLLEAITSRARA